MHNKKWNPSATEVIRAAYKFARKVQGRKEKDEKTYIVTQVSDNLDECKIAGFGSKNDKDAKVKFKQWYPEDENGFLKYKLYRLVDTAAGK